MCSNNNDNRTHNYEYDNTYMHSYCMYTCTCTCMCDGTHMLQGLSQYSSVKVSRVRERENSN